MVGSGSRLVLPNVGIDNAGIYTCRVSNEAGDAVSLAELIIFGKHCNMKHFAHSITFGMKIELTSIHSF